LDTESHHDFELGEAQGLSLHHLGATLPSHRFSMSVSALPEHLTLRALLLFVGCLDTSVDYIQIVEKNAVRKKINSEVYVST
jgi:hypothetical protein